MEKTNGRGGGEGGAEGGGGGGAEGGGGGTITLTFLQIHVLFLCLNLEV